MSGMIETCPPNMISEDVSVCHLVMNDPFPEKGDTIKTLECAGHYGYDVFDLNLERFPNLEYLFIGDDAIPNCRNIHIKDMMYLKAIRIGCGCFYISVDLHEDVHPGSVNFYNCPLLQSIEIGPKSFTDFYHFRIASCQSLSSLKLGENCFKRGRSCTLEGN